MKYIWDNATMKWVPKATRRAPEGVLIMPDLPDVISPIDKTVINGRAGLRQHMKQHGVTFTSDYDGEWKAAEKRREDHFNGRFDTNERKQAIARAIEQNQRRRP